MIVRPSSAARISQCPGSIRAEAAFPELEPSVEAEEGTAAHWVAQVLAATGSAVPEGAIAPNGTVVTNEMSLGARLLVDTINGDLSAFGLSARNCNIERLIKIPRVHPNCLGTPDYSIWASPRVLWVWDYKFGHRYVEVFENPQVSTYAAGEIEEAGVRDIDVEVHLCIIQPRSFHPEGPVRRWVTNGAHLRGVLSLFSNYAHEGLDNPNPRYMTGPECLDCNARHACDALASSGYKCVDESTRRSPHLLDAASLGRELAILSDARDRLKARHEGLIADAMARSRAGTRIPGWTIERSSGRRVWSVPADQVIQMGLLLGKDLAKPREAITPRQAEDAGFDPTVIAAVSRHNAGAPTLVRDTGVAARKAFGNFT